MVAKPTRALLYARLSNKDKGRDVVKVMEQLKACAALAQDEGYEVVGEYADDGISASNFAVRPDYLRLLQDFAEDRGDVIVAWQPDRLTRRHGEVGDVLDIVEARGSGWVHFPYNGLLDLTTPEGESRFYEQVGKARYEVRVKGLRQKKSGADRRAAGVRTNTTRPFGYEKDGVTLRPEEANLIREASQAVLEGLTFYKVARIFRDSGLMTVGDEYRLKKWTEEGNDPNTFRPNGWPVASVSKMLTRARNAGIVEHKGVIVPDVVGQWETIITPDELMTIRARLGARKGAPVRDKEPRFWLTNIARCGGCGHRMHSHYTHEVAHLQCEGRTRRLRTDIGHGVVRMHIAEAKVREAIILSYFVDRGVSGLDEMADLAAMDAAHALIAEKREEHARYSAAIGKVADPTQVIKLADECTGVIAEQEAVIERIRSASAHAKMVAGLRERLVMPLPGHEDTAPRVKREDEAALRAEIGERFDALDLADKRTICAALVDVQVFPGRGPDRVIVTHKGVPAIDEATLIGDTLHVRTPEGAWIVTRQHGRINSTYGE